jgi:cysteine-rich repeat protein
MPQARAGAGSLETDCRDGIDDDADGLADCDDADCQQACSESCVSVPPLASLGTSGTVAGHADVLETSCGTAGSELVYVHTPDTDGVVAFRLLSDGDLTLAVFGACEPGAELVCGTDVVSFAATKDEPVFVVVEGPGIGDASQFWLSLAGCGDLVLDPEEECDDGGQVGGDGCDEQCRLESSETADNDTIEHADELSGERYFGTLDANADVDVVHLSVVSEGTSVAVTSVDVGGGCLLGRGTVLELLLSDGEVLSSASEPPSETCAAVSAEDLSPGDYYVRVSHDDGAHFAYALNVAMRACGNGLVEIGELCDDGNRDRGDGCSDTCFLE